MSHLAIHGGAKVVVDGTYSIWPIPSENAVRLVAETVASGKWGRLGGMRTAAFEQEFATYQGLSNAVAVTNGTVALELSLIAAGVQPLDEVIVPALTFVASAAAVVRVGAIPIFVDSDPASLMISPSAVSAAIGDRTRAVIAVHYGGYPSDLDALVPLCARRGIALIEDCAHAQGTRWRDRGAGTFGAAGAFSFQASKSLSLGEGGLVTSEDPAVFERVRLHHDAGRVAGRPGSEHHLATSGYRMTELQGALGLDQLARLPEQVESRQMAGRYLAGELARVGGLSALPIDPRVTRRGYYFMVLRYDAARFAGIHRDRFVEALRAEGVPCGAGYALPLHQQPAFERSALKPHYARETALPDYPRQKLPIAERFCLEEQVTIPHAVLLAERSGLDALIEAVAKVRRHADELL